MKEQLVQWAKQLTPYHTPAKEALARKIKDTLMTLRGNVLLAAKQALDFEASCNMDGCVDLWHIVYEWLTPEDRKELLQHFQTCPGESQFHIVMEKAVMQREQVAFLQKCRHFSSHYITLLSEKPWREMGQERKDVREVYQTPVTILHTNARNLFWYHLSERTMGMLKDVGMTQGIIHEKQDYIRYELKVLIDFVALFPEYRTIFVGSLELHEYPLALLHQVPRMEHVILYGHAIQGDPQKLQEMTRTMQKTQERFRDHAYVLATFDLNDICRLFHDLEKENGE